MASKLVIETRMADQDKWEAYGSFDDFDTCMTHIINLKKNEQRIVRLIVPGSCRLTPAQEQTLEQLGVQHIH